MQMHYEMKSEAQAGDDALVAQVAGMLLQSESGFPTQNDITKAVQKAVMVLDESRAQVFGTTEAA